MNHREIRDFSEHLRILGYPNAISWASLDNGSFPALGTILQWLAGRVEQGGTLTGSAASEGDRVLLIRSAVEFMATKAGIKLNPRRLYGGGGGTAKELLKITSLLVSAPRGDFEDDNDRPENQEIDLTDKISELRTARALSSELTTRGASLYDLLAKELNNKEIRNVHVARTLELSSVEAGLRTAIETLKKLYEETSNYLTTAKNDSETLQTKVLRKQSELERAKQRLTTLNKVRPAFLDELERLEDDLSDLYEQYVLYIRCQAALKTQLKGKADLDESFTTQEVIKKTISFNTLKKPIRNLPNQEYKSNSEEDDDDDDDSEITNETLENADELFKALHSGTGADKLRTKTRLRVRTGAGVERGRLFGGMRGAPNNLGVSDTSLDDTSNSLEIDGTLEGDLLSDDDSITTGLGQGNNQKPPVSDMPDISDEDF